MFAAFRQSARPAITSDWRGHREFDNHQFVMALTDEASGLKAYVAVHSTNLGSALGGTRMKTYNSDDAALVDVLNLSKAMSYKCALARLPYGGGKGVIIVDPELDRQQLLAAYARLVDKLGGLFKTGTDVGVSDTDVAYMGQFTKHMLGLTPGNRGELTTSTVAALGVFQAMKACLQQLYQSPDFAGRSVAIKGVGKLGEELTRLVTEAGGSVVASDINPAQTQALQTRFPAVEIVSNEVIHTQPVDIYAPCALGNEFTEATSKQLHCKAIAGGANNQLASDDIGVALHGMGILYTPDYIANAGGLIYVSDELESDGFHAQRVLERTYAIERTVAEIFQQAAQQNHPTNQTADQIAINRIQGAAS